MSEPEAPFGRFDSRYPFIGAMDAMGLADTFTTPNGRQEFIRQMDPAAFEGWLATINHSITATAPQPRRFDEGSPEPIFHKIDIPGHAYVAPDDPGVRRSLMYEALAIAQQLPDTKEIGQLFSFAIAACRPFKNRNDHTAVVVQELFDHGYDGSISDKKHFERQFYAPHRVHMWHGRYQRLATSFCRSATVRRCEQEGIDSGYITPPAHPAAFEQGWLDPEISEEAAQNLKRMAQDSIFSVPVFVDFILTHKPQWELQDYYEENGSNKEFSMTAFLWLINSEEALQLGHRYDDLKAAFIRETMTTGNHTPQML